MSRALPGHWPEYLIEAWALGVFMVSAALFTTLLEYPESPVRKLISSGDVRRVMIGLAMGATAIALIYSPWGRRSGAHMNPATTLAFWRMGKVSSSDAAGYIVAQFIGGTCGVFFSKLLLGETLAHESVSYVATVPGRFGIAAAFLGEMFISCGMMSMVLAVTNMPRLARFTGLFAGVLVALFISLEAPVSGMSMNPARTFASAFPGGIWTHVWIYFTAPVLGMLIAAQGFERVRVGRKTACPKLHHGIGQRCIFCGYEPARRNGIASASSHNLDPSSGVAPASSE